MANTTHPATDAQAGAGADTLQDAARHLAQLVNSAVLATGGKVSMDALDELDMAVELVVRTLKAAR